MSTMPAVHAADAVLARHRAGQLSAPMALMELLIALADVALVARGRRTSATLWDGALFHMRKPMA